VRKKRAVMGEGTQELVERGDLWGEARMEAIGAKYERAERSSVGVS